MPSFFFLLVYSNYSFFHLNLSPRPLNIQEDNITFRNGQKDGKVMRVGTLITLSMAMQQEIFQNILCLVGTTELLRQMLFL